MKQSVPALRLWLTPLYILGVVAVCNWYSVITAKHNIMASNVPAIRNHYHAEGNSFVWVIVRSFENFTLGSCTTYSLTCTETPLLAMKLIHHHRVAPMSVKVYSLMPVKSCTSPLLSTSDISLAQYQPTSLKTRYSILTST